MKIILLLCTHKCTTFGEMLVKRCLFYSEVVKTEFYFDHFTQDLPGQGAAGSRPVPRRRHSIAQSSVAPSHTQQSSKERK